ncbi:MAG: CfrBI family restriction endonuclease [Methanobrevibacter sp.]|jgi:hypothetical protein|nr:CfrBI family restriction endonuclease [Candidatus Methanovirga procula]
MTENKLSITEQTRNIIVKLLNNENYRPVVQTSLDAEFLEYVIKFFKKIVNAKLGNENITSEWYKQEFLNENLDKKEIAYNAGLNLKTITNTYNSATKEIVLSASLEHYAEICNTIDRLIEDGGDINISLTIKFKGISVELDINESLIVVNSLAVRRAAFRGGTWSQVGKNVEKPLMIVLCELFSVPKEYYSLIGPKSLREVDFYLIDNNKHEHRCEIKLMGKGNPESADVIHARNTDIFVADALSTINKKQLDEKGIQWIELRESGGYKKFAEVLNYYKIPHEKNIIDFNEKLEKIFNEVFIIKK